MNPARTFQTDRPGITVTAEAASASRRALPGPIIRIERGRVGHAPTRRQAAIDLSTGARLLVDQHRLQPVFGRRNRRRHSRRTAAENEQIGHAAGPVEMTMPAASAVTQPRRIAPSMATRQDWQTPIMQNAPRGVPETGLMPVCRTPSASKVTATISPTRPGRPPTVDRDADRRRWLDRTGHMQGQAAARSAVRDATSFINKCRLCDACS